ncbi:MAG: hypothetical protein ABH868_05635 [bacterium]
MNIKKFIGAAFAVFVAIQVTDAIIHGAILGKTYMAMENVWRADMMSKMWIMRVTSLIFALLFVYIFSKGYEGKGVIEGIRFGIIIGFLMNVVGVLNQYVIYPVPFTIIVQWFGFGMLQFIIYGIIVALIYKPIQNAEQINLAE